ESLSVERARAVRTARMTALTAEGRRAMLAGDNAAGLAALEELAKYGIEDPSVLVLLALARRAPDPAGARAAPPPARTRPGITPALRLGALLLAGLSAHAAHRTARALECFHAAQQLAPNDPRGYDFEARVWLASQDLATARAVVEKGLGRRPGDPTLTQ